MLHTSYSELFSVASIFLCTVMWGTPSAQEFRMAADTNRDGVVDFATDRPGHDEWTAQRGAIFLNNNNDSDGSGAPDNGDTIVNGDADLEDLAKILIGAMPGVDEGATLTVSVDAASRDRVRIFFRNPAGDYDVVEHAATGNLDAALLADGDLELRIEALTFADASWSGETRVTATLLRPDRDPASDTVALRVSPWIMLSNINEVTTVYVRDYPTRNEAFVEALGRIVPEAGAELFVVGAEPVTGYPANNIWMQDTMEIGYTAWPGGWRNVVMPANRNKPLDNFARDYLLGPDFGWFRVGNFRSQFGAGTSGNSWLDWFGNLEVTPPLPGFPFGRVIYGADGTSPNAPALDPRIIEMIDAQGLQGPALRIDVGWLLIKHADETVSFLPSVDPESRYKVMVPDTGVALGLFRQWQTEGKGALQVFQKFSYRTTVSGLLANTAFVTYNENLQRDRIEPLITYLKSELGLEERDLIRVPFLQDSSRTAYIPNLVNSLVVNGHLVASEPAGPVHDGKDLLEEWFRAAMVPTGLTVHFVDDWRYHTWSGNVHCGTNARRLPYALPWWEALGQR